MSKITSDQETELDQLIESSIPLSARDCHVERAKKLSQRERLKIKIKEFIQKL